MQLVLSIFCRGISKHAGALDCVKTVHNGDQAECLQYGAPTLHPSISALIIFCLLQLHGSLSPSRKEQLHPWGSLSKTPYIQWSCVFIRAKPLLWACLHRASSLHRAMHVHKARSAWQDPLSQCLAQMLQLVQVQKEPRFKSPVAQCCQTPVSCMLSGERPLGTNCNCLCQYFLRILATNILVNHMTAQNIFFCSREANYVAPSCFCHD